MELILACLATGALAGITAGLFGVGGGLIIVPALALLLPGLGIAGDTVMQIAIGTSLAVISATAVSSSLAHHRRAKSTRVQGKRSRSRSNSSGVFALKSADPSGSRTPSSGPSR